MKDKTEKQLAFISLRAGGMSFDAISAELHISKGTAVSWAQELDKEVSQLRSSQLDELYQSYGMLKENRIKALGDTLNKINEAIEDADFSRIPVATLLRLKLEYQRELKSEFSPYYLDDDITTPEHVITALNGVLERVRRGELSTEQIHKELTAIRALQSAIEDIQLNAKLDELERILQQ